MTAHLGAVACFLLAIACGAVALYLENKRSKR
jgi:hypothetical protein